MNKLKITDKNKVSLAIGKESGCWYVQTTDIESDTYLSEPIQENISDIKQALLVAKKFQERYGMTINIWARSKVHVKNFGIGEIFRNEITNMNSVKVIFKESNEAGYFNIDQLEFI